MKNARTDALLLFVVNEKFEHHVIITLFGPLRTAPTIPPAEPVLAITPVLIDTVLSFEDAAFSISLSSLFKPSSLFPATLDIFLIVSIRRVVKKNASKLRLRQN